MVAKRVVPCCPLSSLSANRPKSLQKCRKVSHMVRYAYRRYGVSSPEDIHPLIEGEDGQSEGHRKLSRIWKVVGVGESSNDDAGVQEGSSIIHLGTINPSN